MNDAPTKVMNQLMRCLDCGATATATCECGVSYVPAGEYAKKFATEHPEMSNRAVAEKAGVSYKTVERARRAAGTNVSPAKRTGKDGKAYPATQPATKRTAAVDFVRAHVSVHGKKPGRDEIVKATGVSDGTAGIALLQVKTEQPTVPVFTKVQEHQIEAAIAVYKREIEKNFEARVIEENQKQIKVLFPDLEKIREEAILNERHYRLMIEKTAILTEEEYRTILTCLHPDNVASKEKRDTAFKTWVAVKVRITG